MTDVKSISFRKMVKSDLAWFLEIRNFVRSNLHDSRSFTFDEVVLWFDSLSNLEYFVIEICGDGNRVTEIGYIRYRNLNALGVSEIGMDLHPNFQGQSLAYKAYVAFAIMQIETSDIRLWILRVKSSNNRALKLYSRLGFDLAGKYKIDSDTDDLLMFATVLRIAQLPA